MATLSELLERLPLDKKIGLIVIVIILLTIFFSGFGKNYDYGDTEDWTDD